MRRALIALFAALPTFAAAQSTAGEGTISTSNGLTTINIAQCSGNPNTAIGLNDEMNVDLTWTVAPATTGATISGGVFRLYASKVAPKANGTAGASCTDDADNDPIPVGSQAKVVPLNNGGSADITATGASTTRAWTYSLKSIVSAAGLTCTDTSEPTVYLCVQWIKDGAASGSAKATLTLDATVPAAPTNVRSSPGDRMLHVSCDATDEADDGYQAVASAGTGGPWFSGKADSCTDLRIGGLTNGTQYSVVVYKMNAANNPSAASTPALSGVSTTPIPTDDFWQHYDGQDSGGCATGAGAAGLLGALALLALTIAVRRRKS